MWIIAKSGFVSLVQHNTDSNLIRARARRREHLVATFDLTDDEVIDLGPNAPDYRWHCDIPRDEAATVLMDAVMALDYTSHVKEEVSGPDNVMHRAMMSCWSALYRLQRPDPVPHDDDWWTPSLFDDGDAPYPEPAGNWDDVINDPDEFQGQVRNLADKMLAGSADTAPVTLTAKLWTEKRRGKCVVCDDDILADDEYVDLPGNTRVGARTSFNDHDAGPAHGECAEQVDYDVNYDDVDEAD